MNYTIPAKSKVYGVDVTAVPAFQPTRGESRLIYEGGFFAHQDATTSQVLQAGFTYYWLLSRSCSSRWGHAEYNDNVVTHNSNTLSTLNHGLLRLEWGGTLSQTTWSCI